MAQGDCEECLHHLEGKNWTYLFKKALALVKHPISQEDVKRQLKIINECIIVSQYGYYVQEIPVVMELVDAIRSPWNDDYQESLLKLLNICGIPPRMIKASDLLVYADDVKEYFSWFGYLLVCGYDFDQQQQVVNSLIELLTDDYPSHKQYLSLAFRQNKAHESRLCGILGDFLEIANDDIYGKIMDVVLLLIEGTEVDSPVRKEFIQKHVIWNLIARFEPTWRERIPHVRPNMPTGSEEIENKETAFAIIFHLLKYPKLNNDVLKTPANFTLWSLQWAFRLFCIKEARQVERNNVLAILLKIMDIFPDVLSGNLPFAYDIAKMAMSADFPDAGHWSNFITMTNSSENFDCLNLMLMCIAYFPHVLSSNKVLEECRIIPGLIKLMTNTQITKWPMKHHCLLVSLSLDVLRCLADCTGDEFLESGGPYRVLKAITLIRTAPDSNTRLLKKCVEVLNRYCLKSRCVKESVWFNNGIPVLLSVCEDIINSPILSLQKQNLLSSTFNLLHKIVKSEAEMKATMPTIMAYFRRYYSLKTEDPVMDPSVMCFVLKLLWEIFLRSKENTKHFVNDGGVYLLLDIIYVSCFSVKLVALGALVDLCSRAECIPYLITWRKDGKRIISMLMEIFRKENHRLHVKVGPHGEIVDPNLPIMGNIQFYQTHCQCAKSGGNPSIADLFISCRPKVYCLLHILNNVEVDTTKITNDFYKLYDEELSIKDQGWLKWLNWQLRDVVTDFCIIGRRQTRLKKKVTLLVAENFLALKMSEEWQELGKEFEKIGFEPTPADKTIITSMIEVTQKWGELLQHMQKDVIEYHTKQERIKELDLYQQLREARLSDALDGLFQLKQIARTSEKMFKVATNYNMMHTVESNLECAESYGTLHRTFHSNISLALIGTPIVNYVNKDSNASDKISKDIHFVSPANSITGRNQVRISLDNNRERDDYCSKDMLHRSDFFE